MKYTGKWWDNRHRTENERSFAQGVVNFLYGLLAILGILFLFTSCEKEFNPNVNYVYTFSVMIQKDEWGIETWGAHQIVLDEKIEDPESFKRCYVAYLKRTGKDIDGLYNKIYYQDSKRVNVKYERETRMNCTYKDMNNCNE